MASVVAKKPKPLPPTGRVQSPFDEEKTRAILADLILPAGTFLGLVRPPGRRRVGLMALRHRGGWLAWQPDEGLVHVWLESDQQAVFVVAQAVRPFRGMGWRVFRATGFLSLVILSLFFLAALYVLGVFATTLAGGLLMLLGGVVLVWACWRNLFLWRGRREAVEKVLGRIGSFLTGALPFETRPGVTSLERHRLEVMEKLQRRRAGDG